MVDISIIIPTFNRPDLLSSCLRSVIQNVSYSYEVIVVNDYKQSEVIVPFENSCIKVVNNPKQGVASARNYGANFASSSNLLFIDDDMIIRDKAIDKVITFLNKFPNKTYNTDWVYPPDINQDFLKTKFGKYINTIGFNSLKGMYKDVIKDWKKNSLLQVEGITSQFLGIKKLSFNKLKGYNEEYPFAGFEDYDFSQRLKSEGVIFVVDTSVCLYHNELDRLTPRNFMLRRRRGSVSRKYAVKDGHTELLLDYNTFKGGVLKLLVPFEPAMLFVLQKLPRFSFFDRVYLAGMNGLIAVNIYMGYTQKK